MVGFNYRGPFDPAQLQPGFRMPPAAPPLPSMPGMQMPQQQGGNPAVGAGMGLLGLGLDALKGMGGGDGVTARGPQGSGPGGAYTTADAMGMAGLGGGADKQLLGPMDASYGDLGGPGSGPVGIDFLTGLWRKLGFGGGA